MYRPYRLFLHNALILLVTVLVCVSAPALAQNNPQVRTPFSTTVQPAWLQQVMPGADSFSEKAGTPPVYQAFQQNDDNSSALIGYVFLSSDLPPEEKGYSAPIAMLIGMDTEANLTGIKILNYTESYRYTRGDFIADAPFQAQFAGKSVENEFRLARDIDGMSGATMSSFAIARGARNAARRVAAAYLGYVEGDARERRSAANAMEQLALLSWDDMLAQGSIKQVTIPMPVDSEIQLSVAYMGRQVLGEYLIGTQAYTRAERESSSRLGSREMLLLAVGGSAAHLYRQDRLSLQQGDGPVRRVQQNRFVTAGNADNGAIAGKAAYAGAIVLEDTIDVTRPFRVIYSPPGYPQPFVIEYELNELGLALARDEYIPSTEEIAQTQRIAAGYFAQLRFGPPWIRDSEGLQSSWQEMPLAEVFLLLSILVLAMAAFLRKSSRLRWIALSLTLLYLGFIDGGFLSVSHLTATLAQGPASLLNSLPLLLLVAFTLVTTLLWGRVFCSSLCPFGAVQDFIARFSPKRWRWRVPQRIHDNAIYIKYAILALIVVMALVQSDISIFQYFEPFGTLFYFSASLVLWTILLLILLASVFVERFYCRYVCPLGAALGVVALVSPLRIKRVAQCNVCTVCEHACPTGAIRGPAIDFKECVRCDICESKLLTKAGTCRHPADEVTRRLNKAQVVRVLDLEKAHA